MNKQKRKDLSNAVALLTQAWGIVESVLEEEQDSLDSFPEGLQGNPRYEKMESAVDNLVEASDDIDGAIECIQEAIK